MTVLPLGAGNAGQSGRPPLLPPVAPEPPVPEPLVPPEGEPALPPEGEPALPPVAPLPAAPASAEVLPESSPQPVVKANSRPPIHGSFRMAFLLARLRQVVERGLRAASRSRLKPCGRLCRHRVATIIGRVNVGADDPGERDGPDDDRDGVVVMEIEDWIDLHTFQPREIPDVVDSYLEAAAEKGFHEVRIIHGRGKGVQRQRVRAVLERSRWVEDFSDAPGRRGGWGATLVWLRPARDS